MCVCFYRNSIRNNGKNSLDIILQFSRIKIINTLKMLHFYIILYSDAHIISDA